MKVKIKATGKVLDVTSIQTCVEKVNEIGQHILHYNFYKPEDVEILDENKKKFNPTCLSCNSYQDGYCTNFGKDVSEDSVCKFYRKTIIEYTCQHCGRVYDVFDSDADNYEKFCCKACEYGY